jgi:hypothetical protein
MDNTGDVNIYNPDKQLSEQVTLRNILRHSLAMSLATDGTPEEAEKAPKTPNERVSQMFKGLNLAISSQQTIIGDVIGIVYVNSKNSWKKRNKKDEEKKENPFEDDDNDFNELNAILGFLEECEQKIITANKTKMFEDDFVWEKQGKDGDKVLELSPHFFNMRGELRISYREIYIILINNKIVSSGVVQDEALEDRQIEEEFLRRIVDS